MLLNATEHQLCNVFWFPFSWQGPQTEASHQWAVVYEQLAQGSYLIVEWPGVKPATL